MDAVEAASRRNAERDRMNALRVPLIPETQSIQEQIIPMDQGGNGGENASVEDTRTDYEKYQDAIKVNNSIITAVPVVGPIVSLMNDNYIQDYEKENPNARNKVQGQRYSTVGRLLGFGDPGTTGFSGVFGSNSNLYNAGFHNLSGGGIGYAGAPMVVAEAPPNYQGTWSGTVGGQGGGNYSGQASYGQTEASGGTYGERDDDGNVSASPF